MIGRNLKKTVLPKIKPTNIVFPNNEQENNVRIERISIKSKLFNSTLQFFMKPIKADRLLLKIFWLTLLIISIFGCLYYVVLSIIDFLQYSTTTSIYKIIEKESEFPTISFCSDNDRYLIEPYFEIKIIKLWFNYKDLTSEWQNHIEQYNDPSLGKCYRFNSGKNMFNESIPIKKSQNSGFNDGFELRIYSNVSIDFSYISIYIYNHTETPSTIHNKGTWVRSGSDSNFVIKRIYDEKLPKPYNECFKNVSDWQLDKTIIKYMKSIDYHYNQKECIIQCRNYKSMESGCNCSISRLGESFRVKCVDHEFNNTIRNCSMKFLADFDVDTCTTNFCPLECDSFSYEIFTSFQTIVGTGNISESFESRLFKNYSDAANHYYGIYAYYDDLKYTFIKQYPKKEFFGLISEIGGTFSLFLGISIFSCLEVFELVIELISKYF